VGSPETCHVRVGDDIVSYQVVGEGPVVSLWCGLAFSHDLDLMWDHPSTSHFLGAIAAVSQLVLVQSSGSATDRLDRDGVYEASNEDLAAVLDAVEPERVVMIAGGDSGSFGLYFATTQPESVHGLVTMNCDARLTRADDYPCGIPREVLDRVDALNDENRGRGENLDVLAPSVAEDLAFKSWFAKSQRATATPAVLRRRNDAVRSADLRPLLANITVPTVVIQRSGDRWVRAAHGRYLADHIAGAKYVEVPGDDHLPYVGDVDPILSEITELITGVRGAAPFRQFATLLYSDIVGSTSELTAVGDDEWRTRLDQHDAIVERCVTRTAGKVVKMTGDGFVAIFDSPTRAASCATAVRDELATIGLVVRMGLHAAEIERRGADVSGIGVHIAARIANLANPGDILATRTVKDLTLGSKLVFTDEGTHRLKGVSDPWQIFRLEPQ
jgi:class 3 adenylate cyclase